MAFSYLLDTCRINAFTVMARSKKDRIFCLCNELSDETCSSFGRTSIEKWNKVSFGRAQCDSITLNKITYTFYTNFGRPTTLFILPAKNKGKGMKARKGKPPKLRGLCKVCGITVSQRH